MTRVLRLLVAGGAALAAVTVGASAAAPVAAAADGSYVPLPPARVLDTREGVGAPQAAVGEDQAVDVTVAGVGGVPAQGVAAVVLNVTGTEPTAPTFVAAYPAGGTREGSVLNLQPGQTDSNLVIATVGQGGQVSLYNAFGTTHLIADVAGWFPTGGAYKPLAPARILDTREGLGTPPAAVAEGHAIDVTVTGAGGVPSEGVGAVVLNVTGTEPTAPTFVSAYPSGGTREGSALNLQPGQTDSNLVIATVGQGGQVSLYNAFGTTHLIADVAGWFPAGSAYGALAPTRIVDTREGLGAPPAQLGGGAGIDVTVTGVGGVPSDGVGAVVLNITGTGPTAPTFVSAYPTGGAREGSNLNLQPGQTDSNLVIATVGQGGQVSLYNAFGTTDLIADVAGWFPTAPQTSGTFIAYTCGDNLCAIDPVTKAQTQLTTDGTEERPYDWPSLTADGSLLAAGRDETIVVGTPGGSLSEVWAEDAGINDVALAPDGSGVAHSYFDQYYGIYPCGFDFCYGLVISNGTGYNTPGLDDDDTINGQPAFHDIGGWGVDYLPGGSVLAAEYFAFDRSVICRYDDPTDEDEPCWEVVVLADDVAGWIGDPDASPDGTLVAAAVGSPSDDDDTSSVQLFDMATGALVRTLAADADNPAFAPDGSTVVYAGADGWLYLVPTAGGQPEQLAEGSSPTWVNGDLP